MLLSKKNRTSFREKILEPDALIARSHLAKEQGEKVATINGSFDLLHPGHLDMLERASHQGDLLFVLLNTDASIQSYKNPKRPINPLRDRLQSIAALEMVDFVSWFSETDPRAILERIQPSIHINGSEYGENCIEREVVEKGGGRIYIVDLLPGYSSTNLIKKIQSL